MVLSDNVFKGLVTNSYCQTLVFLGDTFAVFITFTRYSTGLRIASPVVLLVRSLIRQQLHLDVYYLSIIVNWAFSFTLCFELLVLVHNPFSLSLLRPARASILDICFLQSQVNQKTHELRLI